MEKQAKYLAYCFFILFPLAVLAFYKPYFQFFPNFEGIKGTIHFHTFVAAIWLGLLFVQPLLIYRKKYGTHRLVGKISYAWFIVFIASFIPLMINVAHSEFPQALLFSVADVTLLLLFYFLAIYHRKATPLHMRYMILAAIVFLGPTVGRIGGIWLNLPPLMSQGLQYLIIALILAFLIYQDRSKKGTRKAYYLGAIIYSIHALVFYIIFT